MLVRELVCAEQGQEMIERGVVAKAQGGRHFALQRLSSLVDNLLPQGCHHTLCDALIVGRLSVNQPHAPVVSLVTGAPFVVIEGIVETNFQRHILHIGSQFIEFVHQAFASIHLCCVAK